MDWVTPQLTHVCIAPWSTDIACSPYASYSELGVAPWDFGGYGGSGSSTQ